MKLISNLARRSITASMEMARGPKKKKGETEAKIQSTDIINIFKDRQDPQIKQIEQYPLYVHQLSYGNHSIHEFVLGIQHNVQGYLPQRPNYKGVVTALKRQKIKAIANWKHIDGNPDIMSENDLHSRRGMTNVGGLSKEEQEEKLREEQAAYEAMEDDDE